MSYKEVFPYNVLERHDPLTWEMLFNAVTHSLRIAHCSVYECVCVFAGLCSTRTPLPACTTMLGWASKKKKQWHICWTSVFVAIDILHKNDKLRISFSILYLQVKKYMDSALLIRIWFLLRKKRFYRTFILFSFDRSITLCNVCYTEYYIPCN